MRFSFLRKVSIIAWILLLLSIFYGYMSYRLPGKFGEIGPAFIPAILAVGLFILSILLIFKGGPSSSEPEYSLTKKHVLLFFLLIITYLVALPLLGFLVASTVFLFLVFRLYGIRGAVWQVAYAIILTLVIYFLFKILLKVPLNLI